MDPLQTETGEITVGKKEMTAKLNKYVTGREITQTGSLQSYRRTRGNFNEVNKILIGLEYRCGDIVSPWWGVQNQFRILNSDQREEIIDSDGSESLKASAHGGSVAEFMEAQLLNLFKTETNAFFAIKGIKRMQECGIKIKHQFFTRCHPNAES